MEKKIDFKELAVALGIPLATGGLSALLTKEGMELFKLMRKPPLSPPAWAFPVVWTILYALMGTASYLIYDSAASDESRERALTLYAIQLAVNFVWSLIFFNLNYYLFAFVWLILLWVLILATAIKFYRIRHAAGWMLVPYILWVTLAGYLNFGVYALN